jgi:S-DNA-T family DNA segregation ATPase FtsK/SpoIIIE
MQGVFVSDREISELVKFWRNQGEAQYLEGIVAVDTGKSGGNGESGRDDEPADRLFNEAVQVIAEHDRASSSLLQRRLRVGYARAARIIDELEEKGYVGPADRSNARVVNRDKIAADAAGANGGSTGGTSAAGATGEDA